VEDSPEWTKPNVYNLANVNVSTHETSYAHPLFVINEVETVNPIQTANLNETAQQIVHSVLNRAREETMRQTEIDQSSELETDRPPLNALEATMEQNKADLQSTVSKPVALNAAKIDTSYIEESLVEDLVETNEDELEIPNIQREDAADLAKLTAKKPLLLNKAEISDTPMNEEHATKFEVAQATEESVEIKRESINLGSPTDVSIKNVVKPISMGTIVDEMVVSDRVSEYTADKLRTEEANETKEDDASLLARREQQVELINRASLVTSSDEFLECVKPMDTIELDFQEYLGTVSTHKPELKSPDGVSKTTIEEIAFGENLDNI
jgi:hypothetical protein